MAAALREAGRRVLACWSAEVAVKVPVRAAPTAAWRGCRRPAVALTLHAGPDAGPSWAEDGHSPPASIMGIDGDDDLDVYLDADLPMTRSTFRRGVREVLLPLFLQDSYLLVAEPEAGGNADADRNRFGWAAH